MQLTCRRRRLRQLQHKRQRLQEHRARLQLCYSIQPPSPPLPLLHQPSNNDAPPLPPPLPLQLRSNFGPNLKKKEKKPTPSRCNRHTQTHVTCDTHEQA